MNRENEARFAGWNGSISNRAQISVLPVVSGQSAELA